VSENLFGYIPPRPKWNDEIKKELAKRVGKIVCDWADDGTDLQDCIDYSQEILEYNSNDNGYELAKEFEEKGFSPDAYLVDSLDDVGYIKDSVIKDCIKKWVVDNSLKLDLKIGQIVTAEIRRKGKIQCEIVKLYPETMQYGLWYEDSGCERDAWCQITNYEEVQL
jgi:hypothetical protein